MAFLGKSASTVLIRADKGFASGVDTLVQSQIPGAKKGFFTVVVAADERPVASVGLLVSLQRKEP